jgi:hypothetical protein
MWEVLVAPRKVAAILVSLIIAGVCAQATRAQTSATFTVAQSLKSARSQHSSTLTATTLKNGLVLLAGGYNGSYLSSAELFNPSTGTFVSLGQLNTARAYHAAILLNNGLVLIVGGYGNAGYLASAELYDPVKGTFTPTGSLNVAREFHTATLLTDGDVLITGGYNGTYLSSAEIYDPATGTFTLTGSLGTAREFHTATALSNGKVLIAGGYGTAGYLAGAELYNAATGTFAATGSLTTARQHHTASALNNGTVLIAAGYGSSGYLSSAEIYNASTGTFSTTGSLSNARQNHTVTPLADGLILVAGGYGSTGYVAAAEIFNPATGTFTVTANLNTPRQYHTASLLNNGQVLIAGGNGAAGTLSSAEIYNPAASIFSVTGSMVTARDYLTMTLLQNGTVLVAGGCNAACPISNAEVYNPATGTFAATGSLNTARYSQTANLLANGTVLLAGGGGSSGDLASAELYNPSTGTFTNTGTMTVAHYESAAALLANGNVLITGGTNNGPVTNVAELYNAQTGTFSATGNMTVTRLNHTATLLNNGEVLIAGGQDNNFNGLSSAELYNPETGTFTATGSMTTVRVSPTATLLSNGMVLIAGGQDNNFNVLASAELYNPSTGTFTVTGSMNTARYDHAATLLSSGLVLVADGWGSTNPLSSAELYNPSTGTFIVTGSTNVAGHHNASNLSGGIVLLAGGYGSDYLSSAELYQPASVAPLIATISPISGPAGTVVTITGTNFGPAQGTSTVTFKGTLATPTGWSSNSILVPVPSGAASGNVVVTVGGLASNGVPFNDTFSVLPILASVTPSSGAIGTSVTIKGTSLGYTQGTSAVLFNGVPSKPTSWGPSSSNTFVQKKDTYFANSTGAALESLAFSSNVGAGHLLFCSIGWEIAGGSTISLVTDSIGNTFNSLPLIVNSPHQSQGYYTFSKSSAADTVTVFFTGSGGTYVGMACGEWSGPTQLDVHAETTGSSTNPSASLIPTFTGDLLIGYADDAANNWSATGSWTLRSTATNVRYGMEDQLNGGIGPTKSGFTIGSDPWTAGIAAFGGGQTTIVTSVPNGATSGNVVAVVLGQSSNGISFSITGAPPTISSLSASFGNVGTCITVNGSNFGSTQGSSKVTFNGTTASPSSWNSSSIGVCVPTGATTGPVVVTVGSVATNGVNFTVFTGSSSNTGSLTTARYYHTATLLNNGLVLIAGGCAPGGNTYASAQLYNPSTGTFTATGSLNAARCQHTATLLQNGMVLVTGGYGAGGAGIISSAELYNPSTGTFTTTGSMTTVRVQHSATPLQNGLVLIAGGNNNGGSGYLSTAELYNPLTGTFTATGTMTTARQVHTATLLNNGSVLIAGGANGSGALSSAELYSPSNGTFTATGNMNAARWWHEATLLQNGTVLVEAGDNSSGPLTSAELYNPSTGTFATTGSLSNGRYYFTATPLNNGMVLTAGGDNNSGILTSLELYNPSTGAFSSAGNLNTARMFHTATLLPNGMVLIAAGEGTGNVALSSAELYEPNYGAPPFISSLTPNFGPIGESVLISGQNFGSSAGTDTVTFNGTVATPVVSTSSSIVVSVPPGATTGNVVVSVGGLASNGVQFNVFTAPSITSVSPISGSAGTSVTITGTNFGTTQGTSTVTFNGVAAAPTSWTPTQINVPVPSGATIGCLIVTVSGLSSNCVPFGAGGAVPIISSLSPTSGSVGTSVTIAGANFGSTQGSSTIKFNGTTATPTSWNSGSIVAPVPTGATTGPIVVTVSNVASNGANFTVSGPGITSLWPSSGPVDTQVTITGANFGSSQGASTVSFNGALAAATSWSSTSIVVRVPPTASSGNVVVTVGGVSSNGAPFVVLSVPTITSLSPMDGPVGTSVTITGAGFGSVQGTSTLKFNGVVATPASWSARSISTVVPSGATTGNVVVTISGGSVSNPVPFIVGSIPNITNVNPSSGSVGASVTITGTNFGGAQGASLVTFNGVVATPTSWSATSIAVTVPSGATTGCVVVVVGGLASNCSPFGVGTGPAIFSINPTFGPVGTPVTITGANFGSTQGSSTVKFKGIAGSPTTWNSTQIVVPVPAGATSGSVVVNVSNTASNGAYLVVTGIASPTGGLNAARDYHTMTLLNNGAVLVAGGFGPPAQGGSPLSSAEIYNPTSGGFTTTGSLNTSRYYHTATILPNGEVLVAGGAGGPTGGDLSSAELYNPTTGSFAYTTGSMTVAHYGAAAAPLNNGLVLITGGNNAGSPSSVGDLYNPATGTFAATTGSMTAARIYHTATLLSNGLVLITGGGNNSNTALATAELYNPATETFTATSGTMTTARSNHSAILLPNGMVLISGGTGATGNVLSSAELFNPATGTFAATGSMMTARWGYGSALLNDGTVLVAGGNGSSSQLATTEVYNYSTRQFTSSTSMTAAGHHVAAKLNDGNVLLAGGYNGTTWLSTAELYVPTYGAAPFISSLSQNAGSVGTSITIYGQNFGTTQASVSFFGTPASTITSWTPTAIVVTVPSGATTGPVVVTVNGATSNGVNFTVSSSTPNITGLSQGAGPVGTAITISGANFGSPQGSSTVTFNGVPGSPTSWNTGSITVPVPSGATTGFVVVTVNGLSSNGVIFVVGPISNPGPAIISLSAPGGAIGSSLTITGVNFGTQTGNAVTFNGLTTPSTNIISWNSTQIVLTVPQGASTGNLIVTVGGVQSNALQFIIGPAIVSLSFPQGPGLMGLVIAGINLGPAPSPNCGPGQACVTLNNIPLSVVTWSKPPWLGCDSSSCITVDLPPANLAASGNVVVTVGGLSSNPMPFTVISSICSSSQCPF